MSGGYAPDAIRGVFDQLVELRPEWNLALGGILGDAQHFAHGGYHVPRDYCPPGDYSVQLAQDKLGDGEAASALDLTPQGGGGQAMVAMTRNLRYATRRRDPRIATVVREFAGTVDNSAVFAMDVQRAVRVYGFDNGHLWHVHVSFLREFATTLDPLAVAEVIAGVPLKKSQVATLTDEQRRHRMRHWRRVIQRAREHLSRLRGQAHAS